MAVLVTSAALNFTHSGFKQPFTFCRRQVSGGQEAAVGVKRTLASKQSGPVASKLTEACQVLMYLSNYSITSSARVRIVSGIVIPRAFAVLRFTTSSNLVGRSMGRSAGLVPPR